MGSTVAELVRELTRLHVGPALTEDLNTWIQQVTDDGIETITPSGHRYLSHAPPPVGWREPRFVKVAPGRYQLIA
jgi:hypothetical protein